eukprot:RCo019681
MHLLTCLQCSKPLGGSSAGEGALHLECVDLYRALSGPSLLHEGEHQGIICTADAQRRFGFLSVSKLGNVHFSFAVLPSGILPKCKDAFAIQVRSTSKGLTVTSMRPLMQTGTLRELQDLAKKCRSEIIRGGRFVECSLVEQLMCQKLGVPSLRSIGVVNPRMQISELEVIRNKEALVDQYIRTFVARRRACTLFELEEMIVKVEEVSSFAELKMGFWPSMKLHGRISLLRTRSLSLVFTPSSQSGKYHIGNHQSQEYDGLLQKWEKCQSLSRTCRGSRRCQAACVRNENC